MPARRSDGEVEAFDARSAPIETASRSRRAEQAASGASVSVTMDGDTVPIVSIAGEVDLLAAPKIQEVLDAAFTESKQVVVDLAALDFIDSTGLSAFIEAVTARDGCRLVVRSAPPMARRVIEITGLDKLFEVEP